MDVNGAKALKRRLGVNAADKAPPVSRRGDIPEDAPPVYHWTGVMKPPTEPSTGENEPALRPAAPVLRRLGTSFR